MATKRQVDQPHPVERVPSVSLENNTSLQEWERSSPHKKTRQILASCKTPLLTLPSKKGRKGGQLEARAQETLEETEAHSLENEDEPDYSNFGLFREFLTNEYLRNRFYQPPAVLELSSLFIRCMMLVKKDMPYLGQLRGFQTNARKFHLQLIAALGWIYADSYTNALPGNKSRVQTLSALEDLDKSKYNHAMELVHVLLCCAKKTYGIKEEEVKEAKIGGWFNNRISQIKKGVWSVEQRKAQGDETPAEGLYYPFYLVLRAIHPNCSVVAADSMVRITLAEVWQLLLEPRLYATELHHVTAGTEIKLLPRDIHGVNYNLWFLYDCLQPEPFWSENMDGYFTEYVPEFQNWKQYQGMERLSHGANPSSEISVLILRSSFSATNGCD